MAKALADGRALIEQCSLSGRQDQFLGAVLKRAALSAPAEYILVVVDFNHLCGQKLCQNFLRARMISDALFYIDV